MRDPRWPFDPPRGVIAPFTAAAIVAPFVLAAAVGELWEQAQPSITAVRVRAVAWLRDSRG